jgi:magnesium-transporting ATPase (P-type)
MTILSLDIFILLFTLAGVIYTVYKIRKKKFHLTPRDYGLIGMYFTYLIFTLLSFVVEWSLIFHMHDEIQENIFIWILLKRIVHVAFTVLAITWSSGYKFGGTQPSGI